MSKKVEVIINDIRLNETVSIKIMECLKKHEPDIWHELNIVLKHRLIYKHIPEEFK